MKRATLLLVLLLLSAFAFAQESEPELKTLFGNGKITHGGYGALSVGYSSIDSRNTLLVGGRGAWLINHRIGIGFSGTGFLSETSFDETLNSRYQLAGGYGGLFFEYIVNPSQPIHVSFPLTIGAGAATYVRNNGVFSNDFGFYREEDSDAFFVIEPGIELEMNMLKFMRMAVGVSYRYTSNVNLEYSENNTLIGPAGMLRGINAGITLKFGKF